VLDAYAVAAVHLVTATGLMARSQIMQARQALVFDAATPPASLYATSHAANACKEAVLAFVNVV
jgi:hypothetical protein